MVRYVSPAEYQRLMRERQRAIDEYNRKVDQYNSAVKRNIDKYNRDAAAHNREVERRRQEQIRAIEKYNRDAASHNREVARGQQEQKRAIENYNRAARAHNAQVQANEQRRRSALQRLLSQPVTVRYEVFHNSTITLNAAFERLEQHVGNEVSDANDDLVLDLPGKENANSLEVMNALLEGGPLSDVMPANLQGSQLEDVLQRISVDLNARWQGALFALNPRNPDAARHFCTSAREIIAQILDLRAPDSDVINAIPNCGMTKDGRPTRRAKVEFILGRRGIGSVELGDFVEADIENVVGLFQVFNSATHGEAGKYEMSKLAAIKKRVEGGILFLSRLVG